MTTRVSVVQGGTGANTVAAARLSLGVDAASNNARVYANSGSMQTNVSLNFVNTSTVTVSVTPGSTGNANIAFTSTANIVNDTANTTRFITFVSANSGAAATLNVVSDKLYFNPNTGILSATTFNSLSDEKEKENIETFVNAVDTVKKLRGVKFNWKNNKQKSLGVISQELEKILPELVLDTDGQKTVNYSGIIAVLIEAIKEQQEEIEKLKHGNSTNIE